MTEMTPERARNLASFLEEHVMPKMVCFGNSAVSEAFEFLHSWADEQDAKKEGVRGQPLPPEIDATLRREAAEEVVIVDQSQPRLNTGPSIDAALADFTCHMKHKLLMTRHRPHWSRCDVGTLLARAREELDELEQAYESEGCDRKDVVREAADVANFCMMIADNMQWAGTRAYDSHEGD